MGPSMCTLWLVVPSLGALWGLTYWHCWLLHGAANPLSFFSPFSNSSIRDPKLSPMVGCELPPLYFSGSSRASQVTAISGSYQQALPSIHNSVWVWWQYMIWIPWWGSLWIVFPSVSVPHFVSISPPVNILFSFLKNTGSSTFWSSFFLSFMWSVNCILVILRFGANIHLSVSAYHMCSLWLRYLTQDDIF